MFNHHKLITYKRGVLVFISCVSVVLLSSVFIEGIPELAQHIQSKLIPHYNAEMESVVPKKYELTVTTGGFFRLRKYYANSKQEYYSFNISQFSSMDYLGNTDQGNLILRTVKDDIIVQTYGDPKGNIDSMAQALTIPIKGLEAEDLNRILTNLHLIKRMLKGS